VSGYSDYDAWAGLMALAYEDGTMSVAVNLYVDRMSPAEPVRIADVYAVTQDRASSYTEAAAKIGLTTQEYADFREALLDGGAIYVRLPRHIDAMAAVHHGNGRVYALHNVLVPSGTMGWEVRLADGTSVLIPKLCGNLSMNHAPKIAMHRAVVAQKQPKNVHSVWYEAKRPELTVVPAPVVPAPVASASVVSATEVTFNAPPVVPTVATQGSVAKGSALPFLGLLFPGVASYFSGGTGHGLVPSVVTAPIVQKNPVVPVPPIVVPTVPPPGPPIVILPSAPPCSAGSTTVGGCQQ